MIPVKSISLLSSFKNQQESIVLFENFSTDSSVIGLNRYSISAESFDQALFAGDLEDKDMYIEVSYLDPVKNTYVPRKFDFSNYLRYIENALSVLNNGILGVYLTEARANDIYVRKNGDTMYGSLIFDLTTDDRNNYPTEYPLQIDDRRTCPKAGYISIVGPNTAGINIRTSGATEDLITLNAGNKSSMKIANVLEANIEEGVVTIKKPLTVDGNTLIDGELSAQTTKITGNLSITNNVVIGGSTTCQTLTSGASITAKSLEATGTPGSITGKSLKITDILTANSSDNIILNLPTTINSSLTMTGSDLHIANDNAKIMFGATEDTILNLSYDRTLHAFVMTRLLIQPASVDDEAIILSSSVDVNSPTTDAVTYAFKVNGNAYYKGSVFGVLAIRGNTLVTKNFTADTITALNEDGTGGFIQTNGIANLTAKRACWA